MTYRTVAKPVASPRIGGTERMQSCTWSPVSSEHAQGSVGSIFDGGHEPLVQPAWQQLCAAVLDSLPFMVFSLAVTLVAIFESDFRLAATPASADKFFTVLASLVLVEFAVELVRCA